MLVAQGFTQTHNVDYFDIFNLIIKPVIVQIVLNLSLLTSWSLRQLYVNNAFLNDTLFEDVYMQ